MSNKNEKQTKKNRDDYEFHMQIPKGYNLNGSGDMVEYARYCAEKYKKHKPPKKSQIIDDPESHIDWFLENPGRLRRFTYAQIPESLHDLKRKIHHDDYLSRKEYFQKNNKRYYTENKEYFAAKNKEWYANNVEAHKIIQYRWRNKQIANDPEFMDKQRAYHRAYRLKRLEDPEYRKKEQERGRKSYARRLERKKNGEIK